MNRIESIFEKFRPFGRLRGELYIPIDLGGAFIDECEKAEIMILGMDFYRIGQDDLTHEVDWTDYSLLTSDPNGKPKSIALARQDLVMRDHHEANWISFVIRE